MLAFLKIKIGALFWPHAKFIAINFAHAINSIQFLPIFRLKIIGFGVRISADRAIFRADPKIHFLPIRNCHPLTFYNLNDNRIRHFFCIKKTYLLYCIFWLLKQRLFIIEVSSSYSLIIFSSCICLYWSQILSYCLSLLLIFFWINMNKNLIMQSSRVLSGREEKCGSSI